MKLQMTFILMLYISITLHAQKFTNSYKKIKDQSQTITSPQAVVDIDFTSVKFAPKKTETTYKSIFDLNGMAQYKLVSSYADKDSSSAILKGSVFEPFEKKSSSASTKVVDNERLSIPRRFTFFVHDKWNQRNPANRISSLRITVRLTTDDLQFEKFNGFQTKYEYFDFGTIEGTRSRNFSLGASVGSEFSSSTAKFDAAGNQVAGTSANVGPSVEGSLGGSSSVTENIAIRKRTISQTGMLSGKQMTIYLEGMPLKNLNGPLTVEVILTSDNPDNQTHKEFINFNVKKNKETNKDQPNITPRILIKPDHTLIGDIKADIDVEWSYRYVRGKGNTSFEGDDIIELYDQSMTTYFKDEVIIEQDDMEIEIFNITFGGSQAYLKSKGGKTHPVTFVSREEAIKFRNYILENSLVKVGNYEILKGVNAITASDLESIGIEDDAF